jgi:hypothetical protein
MAGQELVSQSQNKILQAIFAAIELKLINAHYLPSNNPAISFPYPDPNLRVILDQFKQELFAEVIANSKQPTNQFAEKTALALNHAVTIMCDENKSEREKIHAINQFKCEAQNSTVGPVAKKIAGTLVGGLIALVAISALIAALIGSAFFTPVVLLAYSPLLAYVGIVGMVTGKRYVDSNENSQLANRGKCLSNHLTTMIQQRENSKLLQPAVTKLASDVVETKKDHANVTAIKRTARA